MSLLDDVFRFASNALYIGVQVIKKARVAAKVLLRDFFQTALTMMNQVIDRIADRVEGELQGAAHFFRQTGELFQEGTKNYSLDSEIGEWNETIVTRNVSQEAVPKSYLASLLSGLEVNDTRELQNSLEY